VDPGFRLFLSVPTPIGLLLAIQLLWLYRYGSDLKKIEETLKQKGKRSTIDEETLFSLPYLSTRRAC
jgi:hypothetical protein